MTFDSQSNFKINPRGVEQVRASQINGGKLAKIFDRLGDVCKERGAVSSFVLHFEPDQSPPDQLNPVLILTYGYPKQSDAAAGVESVPERGSAPDGERSDSGSAEGYPRLAVE